MDAAPYVLLSVFPQLAVMAVALVAGAWLAGATPGRGRTLGMAGLAILLVFAGVQGVVRSAFWLGVSHGLAETGGNLWLPLADPLQALAQAGFLGLLAGAVVLADRAQP